MEIFFKGPLKMGILTKPLTQTPPPPQQVGLTNSGHLSALRYGTRNLPISPLNRQNFERGRAPPRQTRESWTGRTLPHASLPFPERVTKVLPAASKLASGACGCSLYHLSIHYPPVMHKAPARGELIFHALLRLLGD